MPGRVHLLQHADGNVCVNLRRGQFRVSEHLLDETHIGSPFQHHRRHRVAKQMTGSGFGEARFLHIGTDVTGRFCTRWNERIHRGGAGHGDAEVQT